MKNMATIQGPTKKCGYKWESALRGRVLTFTIIGGEKEGNRSSHQHYYKRGKPSACENGERVQRVLACERLRINKK